MTGRNMAELITKPAAKPINKHPTQSKLTSYCAVKCSKEDKANTHERCVKNPHTIQQSIIKLTVPSKSILELAKSSKPDLLSIDETNTYEHSSSTKLDTFQDIVDRVDKENHPLNYSIKNFSTIISKKLPFETEDFHATLKVETDQATHK